MLVSRRLEEIKDSVKSVLAYEPDEFVAYFDTDKYATNKERIQVDEYFDMMGVNLFPQHKYMCNRTANRHENCHQAIMKAKHPWVIKFDDDDIMLGSDRHDIIRKHGASEVGIVHGDKVVDYPLWQYLKSGQLLQLAKSLLKPRLFRGTLCNSHHDIWHRIFARTTIIRRDAFTDIHPYVDHGVFNDWKYFYWMLRAGWKAVYVPEVMFLQNMNPYHSEERKRWWGRWPEIVEKLDKIEMP